VAVLSLGALAALVVGTLRAVQAAAGDPGDSIYMTGEGLRAWTIREVGSVQKDIAAARTATIAGLAALGLALGVSWLAPVAVKPPASPTVVVDRGGSKTCGSLVGVDGGSMMVADPAAPSAPPAVVQLGPGVRVAPTPKC
jgi:hypothetical protein